jgi:hypothetical protein
MIKTYNVEENLYGYMLNEINGDKKFILYKTKFDSKKIAPYFLKKIAPNEIYISGMFLNKKNNLFNGKTKDGIKVEVKINVNHADMKWSK